MPRRWRLHCLTTAREWPLDVCVARTTFPSLDATVLLFCLGNVCGRYQLICLIRAANPLRSFRELSVSTGIPIQHVHRLSKHLMFWGKVRVHSSSACIIDA